MDLVLVIKALAVYLKLSLRLSLTKPGLGPRQLLHTGEKQEPALFPMMYFSVSACSCTCVKCKQDTNDQFCNAVY